MNLFYCKLAANLQQTIRFGKKPYHYSVHHGLFYCDFPLNIRFQACMEHFCRVDLKQANQNISYVHVQYVDLSSLVPPQDRVCSTQGSNYQSYGKIKQRILTVCFTGIFSCHLKKITSNKDSKTVFTSQ
jgi:hypothetical protein